MTTSTLFHLLPLSVYHADPNSPITSATLEHEGFLHCSPDPETTLAVANEFYRALEEPVIALELDENALTAPVRWEKAAPAPPEGVSADTLFPHVHGPAERSAVLGVHYARRDVHGNFLEFEQRGRCAQELDLLPHPEGGWYRRTWAGPVAAPVAGEQGERPTATAIYFLLPAGRSSAWHTVASDELWLWHRGGPLVLTCGGRGSQPHSEQETITLGPDLAAGQVPQAVVPAGTWQRADASADVETLVSCVVSPGFDFADFRTL
ncbi:cupin domain-containing protein [Haloactinomyces albus]|uniref:Cupin superfamily sugar epimerase/uncharacterized protein (DUF952 family) n=1 Tax=Haloactinomyces albus TaxID=1352928 RepID=A0AAE3ZHW4_9ACTN|nr:cupin domain-containing protein [Haloactinomyces albus]MDR7303239.1 putative cupin superfamily sugar epimerase/uncharacterized protein (DUF952 family) [Haloactinomyces albus]